MDNFELITLLFPGFLAYFFINACIHRKKHSQIQEVYEAILHIILIFFLQHFILKIDFVKIYVNEIILLLLITILYSLVVIFVLEKDYIFKFLRKRRLTTKSLLPSVWIQTFKEEHKNWITLRMNDGTEIYGYPQFYSDTPDETAIYLIYPHWVKRDKGETNYVEVGVKGMFFHDFSKIEFIQFHEEEEE